jgi:KAP family P-loop domain/TIR domain
MAPEPEFDVYLSYSGSDVRVVEELQAQLSAAGFSVFRDATALKVGDDRQATSSKALATARFVAFCVGRAGLTDGQLQELSAAEAQAQIARDFLFAAVLLPGVPEDFSPSALPIGLATRQWLDLRSGISSISAHLSFLSDTAHAPAPEARHRATASVEAAVSRLTGEVTAAALVAQLLTLHPEFGDRRGGTVEVDLDTGERAAGAAWLDRVRALLHPDAATELHGRLVIVGLARLDPHLREQLDHGGFLDLVTREIREPLASLFIDEAAPPEETVPTHTDNPARVDELNREGVARILARRLRDTYTSEEAAAEATRDPEAASGRSFLVHVQGPWGVGKTSLLNFLRTELHKTDAGAKPWVVVTFNAWQHQRLAPPWWWLMTAVYMQGFQELWRVSRRRAVWFRLREWLWRLKGGWPGIVALLVGAIVLVVVWRAGFFHDLRGGGDTVSSATVKGIVAGVAALLTPLLVIWGVVRSAGRWLLTTSARGARVYMQHARDPLETMKEHFGQLVSWLHPYPLAIIIDDLDRCQPTFAVECLEGIQTLFRDVPAAYVVAADREWLARGYASEYASFAGAFDEPGRPLGYLFLEKTFQLTVQIPSMSAETRDAYWRHLIRPMTGIDDRDALEDAREKAAGVFAALPTEEAVREELAHRPGATQVEQRARLEAAAIQLASPKLERAVEHVLHPFRPLLDPNPRAMKRLVNAYGLARGIELLRRQSLGGEKPAQQRTALWTILNLRWPRLAEYLAVHPDSAAGFGSASARPDGLVDDLRPLLSDPAVVAVMLGQAEGVEAKLDPDAIRLCVSA